MIEIIKQKVLDNFHLKVPNDISNEELINFLLKIKLESLEKIKILNNILNLIKVNNLNFQDKKGKTFLSNAIIQGNLEYSKKLISNNINLKIPDKNGLIPIDYSVKYKRFTIFKILIKFYNDYDKDFKNPNRFLIPCCNKLFYFKFITESFLVWINNKIMKGQKPELLDNKILSVFIPKILFYDSEYLFNEFLKYYDVNFQNEKGETLLMILLNYDYSKRIFINILLNKQEINYCLKNNKNQTFLSLCLRNNSDLAYNLIQYEQDFNCQNPNTGETLIHICCYFGHYDILKLLLDKDINFQLKNNSNQTALFYFFMSLDKYNFRVENWILNFLNNFNFEDRDNNNKTIIDYIDNYQNNEIKKLIKIVYNKSNENFKNYLILNHYDIILSLH